MAPVTVVVLEVAKEVRVPVVLAVREVAGGVAGRGSVQEDVSFFDMQVRMVG